MKNETYDLLFYVKEHFRPDQYAKVVYSDPLSPI